MIHKLTPSLYPEDTPKIEHEKTIANIRSNLPIASNYLRPHIRRGSTSQVVNRLLMYFNILHYHTTTLPHIFMSEISLHTAKLPEIYFSKNRRFLGEFRVVYNYIYNIYYIFFRAIYHSTLYFL